MNALVRYLPVHGFLFISILGRVSTKVEFDTRFTTGQAVLTDLEPVRNSLAL